MRLARTLRQPPAAIARRVADQASAHPAVERVEVAGPGFLNIHLDDAWLASAVTALLGDERLGVPRTGAGRTVVLDYSSPNVAKPMHIGHIRSTVIGNALDRLHRFLGYRVVADNHLGDWGTQFGILILGYRHFLDRDALERSPSRGARAPLRGELRTLPGGPRLDGGGPRANWSSSSRATPTTSPCGASSSRSASGSSNASTGGSACGSTSCAARATTATNCPGSSPSWSGGAWLARARGRSWSTSRRRGCRVCIVRKSDGGFNYATTDLATVLGRQREFDPDAIVYVTDERQQLHFRQVFASRPGWA